MIKHNNVLRFNNLSQFNSLIHGFSTTFFGDLRPSHHFSPQSIKKFVDVLGFSQQRLVKMDQVHGNHVANVSDKDFGTTIPETDGLFSQDVGVFLGVITADCVPLLFFDSQKEYVAAIHAGWRGLFSEIIHGAVSEFIKKGSDPQNILVGIGPSIRVCCYSVSEGFVEGFGEKFGNVEKFVQRRDGKIFFDLQKVAKEQLAACGVLETNIEDGDYCTFDHKDLYSYRREGENFGEMMGIIGRI